MKTLLILVLALVISAPLAAPSTDRSACPSMVNKTSIRISTDVWTWFGNLFKPNPSMVNK